MLALELVGSLDTLPGRGELDQDAGLVNANLLVKLLNVLEVSINASRQFLDLLQ